MCSWCISYPPTTNLSRCYSSIDTMCEEREDPSATIKFRNSMEQEVLVTPQRVELNLRVGQPQSFDFTVQPVTGYPVDLYFLVDFSASLKPFIATMKNLSRELADSLSNFTDHYAVGLGAFVDKPVKPFINTHPDFIDSPCDGCNRAFSFLNLLNLTNDTSKLVDALSAIEVSGNIDSPESLLDGMMQAAVCQEVIGWRDQARHLILSISDQGFKAAGQGKYAGIMKRSDEKCHLHNNNFTLAGEFDYPSMSHLAAVMTKYQVIPLLGYTRASQSSIQLFYSHLAEALPRGTLVDLSQGADRLISQFEAAYERLSGEVAVQTDTFSDLEIDLKLVDCPGVELDETSCQTDDENATVTFTATVKVLKCTEEWKKGREVAIRALFFGTVTVFVQAICECPCEQEMSNLTSEACSNSGSLVCGQCNCNDGSYGTICECERVDNRTAEEGCRSADGQICSGKGNCVCGKCECLQGSHGLTCECNDCPVASNGIECFREDFPCNCGVCMCSDGYENDDCSCSPATDQCMSENVMCDGHGTCECNECACDDGYGGQFCDVCINSEICNPQCSAYSECIDCQLSLIDDTVVKIGSDANCSDECQTGTSKDVSVTLTDSTSVAAATLNGTTCMPCIHSAQGTNCNNIQFFICLLEFKIVLQALTTPASCVFPVEAWIIAVPIVIGLLVLGVVILVAIKLILVLLDYLEYKKFLKNVKDSAPGNMINPLYTAPERQIDNPLYEAGGNEQ